MKRIQNRWIVVFLIYADFIDSQIPSAPYLKTRYAAEMDKMLEVLSKSRFNNDSLNIYIIFGMLNYKEIIPRDKLKLFSTADLFQLVPKEKKNAIKHLQSFEKSIINHGNANNPEAFSLQQAKSLAGIFKYIKALHPGTRNPRIILNTWDHGSVFGIFSSNVHISETNQFAQIDKMAYPFLHSMIKAIPEEIENRLPKETVEDYKIESGTKNREGNRMLPGNMKAILTNENLDNAILEGFGSIHLLVMMNCWMMNLHTVYALRNTVRYLIAPQGGISAPGYDYKKIIEFINKKPGTSARCIGKKYVTTSYKLSKNQKHLSGAEVESWAIMMAKLHNHNAELKSVVKLLNKFISALLRDLKTSSPADMVKPYILFHAKMCFNFSQQTRYFQLDFLNLLKILINRNEIHHGKFILSSLEHIWVQELTRNLDKIFYKNPRIGNAYKKYIATPHFPFTGVNIFPPTGSSIYFPYNYIKGSKEHDLFLLKEKSANKLADQVADWEELIERLTN